VAFDFPLLGLPHPDIKPIKRERHKGKIIFRIVRKKLRLFKLQMSKENLNFKQPDRY